MYVDESNSFHLSDYVGLLIQFYIYTTFFLVLILMHHIINMTFFMDENEIILIQSCLCMLKQINI